MAGWVPAEGAAEAEGDFWVTGLFPSGWSGLGTAAVGSRWCLGAGACGVGKGGDNSSVSTGKWLRQAGRWARLIMGTCHSQAPWGSV